jgi:hypothetical protein
MSSAASPALTLDLRPDWLVVAGFGCWSGVILICVWQAELASLSCVLVTVAVVALLVQGVDTQLFGLSPRAPTGVRKNDDGWWLSFPGGSCVRAILLPASRVLPGSALLIFRSGRGCHWLLLRTGPTNGTELRRLRVSMRLS